MNERQTDRKQAETPTATSMNRETGKTPKRKYQFHAR